MFWGEVLRVKVAIAHQLNSQSCTEINTIYTMDTRVTARVWWEALLHIKVANSHEIKTHNSGRI